METGTPLVEPKEAGLELTPQPRIKKLSSAIVWIAAIFAVAVLWLVGYLVSSKARRPNQDHRVASVPPPVEDLAERIQRAAEREAKLAAEQAAAERGRKLQTPADLPPGFEQLLAKRDQPLAAGPPPATYGHEPPPGGRGGTSPGRTELQRALDSDLVPVAFRSGGPRSGSAPAVRGRAPLAPIDPRMNWATVRPRRRPTWRPCEPSWCARSKRRSSRSHPQRRSRSPAPCTRPDRPSGSRRER